MLFLEFLSVAENLTEQMELFCRYSTMLICQQDHLACHVINLSPMKSMLQNESKTFHSVQYFLIENMHQLSRFSSTYIPHPDLYFKLRHQSQGGGKCLKFSGRHVFTSSNLFSYIKMLSYVFGLYTIDGS